MPLLGALLAWLEVNVPEAEAPVRLLWADAGPHNLLVYEGRITGLLDWELAHLGDPLEDLGATVWACLPGTLERDDVLAGYEALGRPGGPRALRYFEALACASRSVMLLAGVQAFLAGTAPPSNAALGQHLLLENLGRAAALAGWEGAGDPAVEPGEAPPAAQSLAPCIRTPWRRSRASRGTCARQRCRPSRTPACGASSRPPRRCSTPPPSVCPRGRRG